MNSVYQVVYNKARRALMVVNEATSCVQAKGTKTVSTAAAAAAAAIVAGLSGTAAAADAPHTTITIDGSTTAEALADIQGTAAFEGFTSVTDKDAYKSGAVYINHNNDAVVFRDGVKFVNNTSEQAGGALELQFGKASLKDAVITGNKADTWGGAIRMAGDSALTLEVSKDTLYSGNRSNVNGKLPYADMGDFAYLNGTSTGKTVLNLKAGKDATLTIADSIAERRDQQHDQRRWQGQHHGFDGGLHRGHHRRIRRRTHARGRLRLLRPLVDREQARLQQSGSIHADG